MDLRPCLIQINVQPISQETFQMNPHVDYLKRHKYLAKYVYYFFILWPPKLRYNCDVDSQESQDIPPIQHQQL